MANAVETARVIHISIHSPRVGRDFEYVAPKKNSKISIHSPRVGRDSKNAQFCHYSFVRF